MNNRKKGTQITTESFLIEIYYSETIVTCCHLWSMILMQSQQQRQQQHQRDSVI